uniref:nucleolin 2-like n=1 Tax=Ciona intestinalis TaxID=7719 RepID=UPI000EF4F2EB|nr:nucleolin 2-like [Ciona intestinalis]|eukprot:XP_026694869.1 nucleolin 2-like [Ciona intestinalis]
MHFMLPRALIVTTDNQPSSHFNTQDNNAKRHISFQKRSLDERSSSSSDTEHIEPYAEVRVDHGSSMEDSDSSSLSSENDVSITPYNPARVDPRSLEEDVESESSTSTVSSMSSIHTPSIVPHDPQVRDRSQPEPQPRAPIVTTDNQPSSHFNTQDNSAKRHISFQKRSLDERSSSSSDTEHIEPYAEVRVDHGSSMEDSDSSSLSSGNDVSITPYNPARVDPRSLEEDVESESSTSTVSSMSSIHTPSIVPHDPQVRDRSQPEPQVTYFNRFLLMS